MKRIILEKVSKKFRIGFTKNQTALARVASTLSGREPKKDLWALKDVSLTVDSGTILGILGENGSGKSTLLRVIAGIYPADGGAIETNGKIISLIGLNIGLQDRLSMKDNISLCCSLFGLSQKTIGERYKEIIEFSELEDFENTKLYQFSSGMLQRLAFSMAIHCNPEILLLDEIFEVGDEHFKKKSTETLKKLVEKGATILLVTHELWMIQKYCDKAIWMEEGKIKEYDDTTSVINNYRAKRPVNAT
ncbi:MAG: ABC transporter ATP-binding protein [Methanobacteriota archaeon]